MSTAAVATSKPNEFGVFETHAKFPLASHRKGFVWGFLATDGRSWFGGYDYWCNDGGGGVAPNVRDPFDSRAIAIAWVVSTVRRRLESHQHAVRSKLSNAVVTSLLSQIDQFAIDHQLASQGGFNVPATKQSKGSDSALRTPHSEIVQIPLDKLHDHPGNPDPTEAEVLQMTQWLLDDGGQDEAITVRPIPEPIGHYQVLAGKTRLAAARRLGWDTLDARIRRDLDDDQNAMMFAARNNSERRTESDLRKAHWLRYQVEQLGMTVADAATTLGMSQGNASNLLAIAEMCDKFAYWRELLISGEMSAAHLRPLKKYRDYPAVMKLLQKDHQTKAADKGKSSWQFDLFVESWGSRDAVEWNLERLIQTETKPLTGDDMCIDERASYEPRFDAGKLDKVQQRGLRAVSIPLPGDKTDRTVTRCFNTKQWEKLQSSARDKASKIAADRSSRSGANLTSGKGATTKRTPAEQRKLDQQRADQLKARIKCWRHAWLKKMVADRLDDHPAIVKRMRLWLETEPFSGMVAGEFNLSAVVIRDLGGSPPQFKSSEAVWKAVSTCSIESLDRTPLTLVRSILLHEDRDPKFPRLRFDHVDDLARMAGIDVAIEWGKLQRSSGRPLEFETFFLLHDKTQLGQLAKELKVELDTSAPKGAIVKRLIGQAKTLPLPKSIATLKADRKPRGKK